MERGDIASVPSRQHQNGAMRSPMLRCSGLSITILFAACASPTHSAWRAPQDPPQAAPQGEAVAATPQRPTLSNDTRTTAKGTVEIEAGLAIDPGDALDTPITAKAGIGDRTEVFVGWSPWQWYDAPGSDLQGASDVVLGARHRFVEGNEDKPSFAVQAAVKAPTANNEVGSGEWDVFGAGILTGQVESIEWTGFYQLGLLGEPGSGVDLRHDLAAAVSGKIDAQWGWVGELAGIFVPEWDYDAVFATGAFTYSPRPDLVFDVGLVRGLSSDAPDWVLQFGVTHNLGVLFGE